MSARARAFRLVNVFTVEGDRFSGNPLCVFEDAAGLDDAQMLALARQFNLSETTFVLPPSNADATARVRIFTPSFEMPFAGHPTLGTSYVLSALRGGADRVVLELSAGLVPVVREGADRWTLRTARGPQSRPVEATRTQLAQMLGLNERDLSSREPCALWVDTGVEQLVIALSNVEAIDRARPSAELLARHGFSARTGECMAYVWAAASPRDDESLVHARFFFISQGALLEDPATGSACANLGGFLRLTQDARDTQRTVWQGRHIARPSRLELTLDAQGQIFVGGTVLELGHGVVVV